MSFSSNIQKLDRILEFLDKHDKSLTVEEIAQGLAQAENDFTTFEVKLLVDKIYNDKYADKTITETIISIPTFDIDRQEEVINEDILKEDSYIITFEGKMINELGGYSYLNQEKIRIQETQDNQIKLQELQTISQKRMEIATWVLAIGTGLAVIIEGMKFLIDYF